MQVLVIGAGVVGLALGAVLIPVTGYVIAPSWTVLKGLIRPARAA